MQQQKWNLWATFGYLHKWFYLCCSWFRDLDFAYLTIFVTKGYLIFLWSRNLTILNDIFHFFSNCKWLYVREFRWNKHEKLIISINQVVPHLFSQNLTKKIVKIIWTLCKKENGGGNLQFVNPPQRNPFQSLRPVRCSDKNGN